MQAYLAKAVREAKQHTSWLEPDADYEDRLRRYVSAVFADDALLSDVAAWVEARLLAPGEVNSLAQKLLQLTMPGVPDVYQGQELTGRFLVDPDNRQPVDYQRRQQALADLDAGADVDVDVEPKLRVTATALRLRRTQPASFAGGYRPLEVSGPAAAHAVAYLRGDDVAVVATRLPVGLERRGGWADTRLVLPEGQWHDALTDRPAATNLAALLETLPVALLTRGVG